MSWDASVYMDTGGAEPLCGDSISYTHNTNSMMRRALEAVGNLDGLGEEHLYKLDEKPCEEVAALLAPALAWWRAQPSGVMDDLEPANGWGSADGCLRFFTAVYEMCCQNPLARLDFCG